MAVLLSIVLLLGTVSPVFALDQKSNDEISFRGGSGSMNSNCDNIAYHVSVYFYQKSPIPIKIEIISPNGRIAGVYQGEHTGSFDVDIDVDYKETGKHTINLHYKGEVYVEDYSWEEYHIPSHDEQIQCLVAKAINKGEHLTYYSLDTNPYGDISRIDTESNRETLKNILGDKFEHYEPILFADFFTVNATRPDTTFALEEMDKLLILLNNYTHSTTSYNNQMAESQIKSMDISDEDKADVLYERRSSYELPVTNYERINKQFVDTTKQSYLNADILDATRIKSKIEHTKYLKELEEEEKQVQKAKDKIIEELKEDEVGLSSPVKQQPKIVPEITKEKVPGWIKNNAKWWSEGTIGDSDFTSGIQYLIKEKIIDIPDLPEQSSETAEEKVPSWIRNNAGWWADGMIGEDDFVNGIKWLVEQGIIKV